MAGDFVPEEELNLKGFHKYYNTYTLRGRFNFVVTTYGVILGVAILYQLLKPAKSAPKLDSSRVSIAGKAGKPTPGNTKDTNVVEVPQESQDPSCAKPPKCCP